MKLLFQNPVFHKGLNTTVRRGIKWDAYEQKGLVFICDAEGNIIESTSISTRVMTFGTILRSDLINEHDPECRSYYSLLAVMEVRYPGFDTRETITIVCFTMEDDHNETEGSQENPESFQEDTENSPVKAQAGNSQPAMA